MAIVHFTQGVPSYGASVRVSNPVNEATMAIESAREKGLGYVELSRLGGRELALKIDLIAAVSER